MSSKAYARQDFYRNGVAVALMRDHGSLREVVKWGPESVEVVNEASAPVEYDDSAWLHLRDDDARAVYEALAEHFGHTGHDMRALRRDYEAERKRVDLLIDKALVRPPIIVHGEVMQ